MMLQAHSKLSNRHAPRLQKRDGGKLPTIVGYAAVFFDPSDPSGTQYEMYPGTLERIMPGAFLDTIRNDDVRALFNHDENYVLGRTGNGTVRLSEDSRGLRYEIDPPDTQVGRDMVAMLERGDVTGSSFSFRAMQSTNRESADPDAPCIVERNAVQLFDVGPVLFPAYTGTSSGIGGRSARRDHDKIIVETALLLMDAIISDDTPRPRGRSGGNMFKDLRAVNSLVNAGDDYGRRSPSRQTGPALFDDDDAPRYDPGWGPDDC